MSTDCWQLTCNRLPFRGDLGSVVQRQWPPNVDRLLIIFGCNHPDKVVVEIPVEITEQHYPLNYPQNTLIQWPPNVDRL